MNWGYKIITVYAVFVAGIAFLVFKSTTQNQDLVTNDYYEQELKYQQRIDEIQRSNALSASVKYKISRDDITISFPEEMKGTILDAKVLLYCTADKSKDIQQEIKTDDAIVHFKIPKGNKGLHELKISWTANKITYYFEDKLMIQ